MTTSPGSMRHVLDGSLDGERHGAQMHGHVIALRDGMAMFIVDGAGVVQPLLDVGREAGPAECNSHLLRDGDEDVFEDLEFDGIKSLLT